LTQSVVSPTLIRQLEDLRKDFPEARWHIYEPVNHDMAYRGAEMAFGRPVSAICDFRKADIVLSLDADFLTCGPGNLRHVADFMARRRVRTTEKDAAEAAMNRLYMVETALTSTGAKADHRLAVPAKEIESLARAIAGKLGLPVAGTAGAHEKWTAAVAKDLDAHRGRCLVLAGDRQPPAVHLLAHVLNDHLGNVGQTVRYIDPIEARPGDRTQSLRELVEDMGQGRIDCLLILDGNPVYTAPADLPFAESMEKVPFRVHLSLYLDETSLRCPWHLPLAHYLEAWSDARAYDGTASIAQPLIEPLYQGRSAHEVVALLAGPTEVPGCKIVRDYWRARKSVARS
jgi:molybdopterin-containing oxidoreductase family iron-sulfur binding subunit